MKRHFKIIALTGLLFIFRIGNALAQNPIIQTIYTADPAPMVYKDTLFLYTGHDEDRATWFVMKDWHVYSTTDMVNWTDRGARLSLNDFKWASKDAWAGQCIERNGKFYWYVPVNAKNGGMSIGVAVGDSPTGPFKDALGKPMITGGWGYIDPTVFIDTDGQAYLYWGNPHLYYVKLNKDMTSYDPSVGIVKVPLTEEAFKLRVINAHKTFKWASSINGTDAHTVNNTADKRSYWYVAATDKTTGKKVIGVGVGDRAIGPFTDVLGKPLITEHTDGQILNPTVIWDAEKQPWLTWQNGKWQAILNADMMSYDKTIGIMETPVDQQEMVSKKIGATVNATEKRMTTYEEGPWFYKRKGLYYLLYPAGGVPEHLAYSTSTSPIGPWKYRDTIMKVIGKGGAFTNHPGLVDYKGKTYLFYHNGALPGGGGFDRSVCVDEVTFDADGAIKRVEPTEGLKNGLGTLDPYQKVRAATIAREQGIETSQDSVSGQGVYVTRIKNNGYVKVRNIDLRKGPRSFVANVAAVKPARIEIHADELDGPLIGNCDVRNTGGINKWSLITTKIKKMTGVHDIYLVFKGEGDELFNFSWWQFR
ncbi:family 43 glycosylhydrolase [Mucilaginibacter daejeonensis]|uniref:family 43 glycosylhydrolase n=1 Tax=Mucilaginibacter daejeonensis TaxID=398049 RepID=UPI001D17C45D|nr:family 43 glycosylhydrolase [Mucilaginibacter daejeonensis]UEG52250.1 family 43 glycosylhydrolase [Mucilaginibacter daejeonensis]